MKVKTGVKAGAIKACVAKNPGALDVEPMEV